MQGRPALRSAPQGAALLRLTARAGNQDIQMMKHEIAAQKLRSMCRATALQLFDIVNGFFKSMPYRRRFQQLSG